MDRFSRYAPLELRPHADPGMDDRSGPTLTLGSLFTMLVTVGGDDVPPEYVAACRNIDPEAWYLGQDLETILNKLEDRDPALPELIGRNIYFMFRTQLHGLGIKTPADFMVQLPTMWKFATRGDSGTWRAAMKGERHAIVESHQPFNCHFEIGGLRGFIEALDAYDVEIAHSTCVRRGDPFCTFDTRWQE
ncbi:hypothetical protein [Polyangium jinanense]|uniref:4-vinyl reductase 4VR domain-containing protein n=1 Tax=Polyangium jinanense TaxID=2829994 RepID=A0A9X3X5M4_9BACT|nr:hypothetical protein [Polyangium jinanense]MDC3957365.1 hypothetical protein [Polyangium jinanense]MDC3982768.1 hypothetical protein [Polyangium jinanense]